MSIHYADETVTLHHGDALDVATTLETGSVDCIVTSPPYFGLRDYGEPGQYGLEASPAEYVETMRALFSELRRVLADDGTLWLNLGDGYARGFGGGTPGPKSASNAGSHEGRTSRRVPKGRNPKDLLGIPWRTAFALQDDGWVLRNAIVWHKPNAMPESVVDRFSTKHEQLFLFSKSRKYHFSLDAVREPHGTNPVATLMRPRPWKHFMAWLRRTSVPTHDFVSARAAKSMREELDHYLDLYNEEVKKRKDFADLHSPELSHRTFRGQHPFTCAGCSSFWPCRDYRWAVDRPDLEVILRDKPSEESL